MKEVKEVGLLTVHQSDSNGFRFGTRLSDPVDVLRPDTKLILALWEKVLEPTKPLFKPSTVYLNTFPLLLTEGF